MYTDQVPDNDLSRGMASRQVETLRVEGVVLVGEHGKYPTNEKGQVLYPRYKLYKQIIDVFRETGQTVPVFSDKHLSTAWDKAKWMYDQSGELKFPFMAGSSISLTWRLRLWTRLWKHPSTEASASITAEKKHTDLTSRRSGHC